MVLTFETKSVTYSAVLCCDAVQGEFIVRSEFGAFG